MTKGEKVGLIAAATFGLYLIIPKGKKSSVAASSRPTIPGSVVNRVMQYAPHMLRYGMEQGVDPALVASVMTVESGGTASATGKAGEVGLMQVMPATALWIARVDAQELRIPATNIQVGTGYIRYCIDQKGGNVFAGIAGYNYGPNRVIIEGNQVMAPAVVLEYAKKVTSLVRQYQSIFRERLGFVYINAFPA